MKLFQVGWVRRFRSSTVRGVVIEVSGASFLVSYGGRAMWFTAKKTDGLGHKLHGVAPSFADWFEPMS